MAGLQDDQHPPPYAQETTVPGTHRQETILETVQKEMYRQRSVVNCDPRHGERIKNFVLFVLATDYNVATHVTLPASDYTHFAKMNAQFADLREMSIPPISKKTQQRRQNIYAWQWEHVFQPCMTIGLPPEFLIEIVTRFFYFANPQSAYTSCVRRIANYHGLPRLAQKLYFDKHIIIPRVISDMDLREQMLRKLNAVSSEYFESVNGVSSEVMTNSTRAKFDITYTLKSANSESSKRARCFDHVKAFASSMWRKVSGDTPEAQVLRTGGVVGPQTNRNRRAGLQIEPPRTR